MKHNKLIDLFLSTIVWAAAIITFSTLVFLIGYILVKGVPYITPSLFALEYNTENVSLLPSLTTTIIMTLISLCFAVPLGIFTAIYLVEYSKRGNKVVKLVRLTAETLSGIPSIIYGLFGLLFFNTYLGWGYSILSGSFTLAIMILPLIMRSSEEALKSVPDSLREGSFGLGAGRLRTVFKITLPSAGSGILAGIILAIGRIVGETAALIYTSGTVARIPQFYNEKTQQFFWEQSASTLSVHMNKLSSEGQYTNQAYATAVVLLIMIIVINALSAFAAKKLIQKREGANG